MIAFGDGDFVPERLPALLVGDRVTVDLLGASGGLAFVVRRRAVARKEVTAARQDLRKDCRGVAAPAKEPGGRESVNPVIATEIFEALMD